MHNIVVFVLKHWYEMSWLLLKVLLFLFLFQSLVLSDEDRALLSFYRTDALVSSAWQDIKVRQPHFTVKLILECFGT